jgi:hypothetical protein
LKRLAPRSLALALLPAIVLICAFSCEVPLAPGYRILRESREIRFVPGDAPALHVRGEFQILNSGSSDLPFVDVNFPDEKTYGRRNLRVEVDGNEMAPASLPEEYREEQPAALRLLLDKPWMRGQTMQLAIDYDLVSPTDSGSRITLGPNDFHLSSRGWFPALLPPKHVLSPYPKRPAVTGYTVRVPADFLLLARGTPKGRKKDDSEIEYRFVLLANDLPPFVVAGCYVKSPPSAGAKSPAFWTLAPIKDDPGPALEQIAQAWNTLSTDFGPLDRNILAPRIVESPELREHNPGESGPAATAFPGGALVNSAALALGIDNEQFLEMVTHALAHDWFGDQIYLTPDAAVGMGEGLPEYATIVVEEARGGATARRARIMQYLQRYDDARKSANETALGIVRLNDQLDQRRIALAKAPLFFIALEDVCGEGPMRSGLRQMVALLRGQEASYDSLRASLEAASGKNLAELFRVWLNDRGIPQDFRDRYQ